MIVNKHDKFVNNKWKGVISEKKKKGKPVLLTRTCPPGLALEGPDMSKFCLLLKFPTFQIQN